MRILFGRFRRPLTTLALAFALVLSTVVPAFAAVEYTPPWPTLPGESTVEPGWPEDHLVASDPAPGQPGYIAPFETTVPPAEGMTDAEFQTTDPAGFAAMLPERQALEAELMASVHELLASAGVTPDKNATLSEVDAATAAQVLAASPYSPYGYLRFTLVPNTTSPYARNGYLGTLYFIYGIYRPSIDAYVWYMTSWPARSGNNRPASQNRPGLGPIPEYTWDFGFAGAAWRGYEPDGREAFYPGKWRLDPWTGGPFGRGYLEVHGGSGARLFGATSGCIRLFPDSIAALKAYYDTKMANKKDRASAHLYVDY